MANFCLPKETIEHLRPRMKALGGAKLVSMTREELATFFEESVGKNLAPSVANSFRNAVTSQRKGALKAWAKRVLSEREQKQLEKSAESLVEEQLHENMEEEVMERALGIDLTEKEVEGINDMVARMVAASKKTPDNDFLGYHTDYFKARSDLYTYLDTINQMSETEVVSRIIFRGNLLFSVKSIVTNVVGNVTGGVAEKIGNVIFNRKASGVNTDLVKSYIGLAQKTFYETGIDVVRAMDIIGGHSVLGEHYKGVGSGGGAVRAYGRFIDQYVMRLGQGYADILAAATHFADNVNVLSTALADHKGLTGEEHKNEARRLFLLATSLTLDENTPDHAEALQIRRTAVQYAMTATYQNDTKWARVALDIRNAIDDFSGDLNLGTNVVPFVKTLINIANLSIQYSGITLPAVAVRYALARKNGDIEVMNRCINSAIRSGLGMTLAMIIAALLDDDDYLPDYTVATSYQKQIASLSNSSYNSIRVGDRWVSLAYFGTFGYALSGLLAAKQKQSYSSKIWTYGFSTIMQVRQTPIIRELADAAEYIAETKRQNKDGSQISGEAVGYVSNFLTSRTFPMIIGDVAKGVDDVERYTGGRAETFDDATRIAYNNLQAKIPFWRELLPPKYNALGDAVATEGFVLTLLTGSRVKSAPSDDGVYKELSRLAMSGEEVLIRFDNFKKMKIAEEMLSPTEYNELRGILQKNLANAIANTMATEEYKNAEDNEERKALLMNIRKEILDDTIYEQGYEHRIENWVD